ncbi:MAG: phosphoribosylamine--glycine ligase [Bacteroidales bacterium]|nr:phosphoribosylamine--glycine ligase [Bacteroidales bacterium]MBQ1937853.1 phosphoribosylamine--glycine ligase [Bacteroidales bacterium]
MKKVLVVGSGGRCHAIVDALSRSPQVGKIYCAPGNAGIAQQAEIVPVKETQVDALLAFAQENKIDLTVVGPEAALAVGIVDAFRANGLKIFGHTAAATNIESSKEFAKKLMVKYDIPTASYRSFTDYQEALDYVAGRPFPAVLKYDGLAAGKGVVIAADYAEADAALKDMLLDSCFGKGKVVVEDFLEGPEFSFMCFVNGNQVVPMPLSQDHKRAYDGDKGPNTGGMGAYTGLPFISEEDKAFAYENVLKKTAAAMVSEGTPLTGVLYGGLIKTKNGVKVIEFNARFGDPETEVVLPLMESDIYDMFYAVATGAELPQPTWSDDKTLGIVLASKGYPGDYQKGFVIEGLENVDCKLYHMGTKSDENGNILTNGGRVMIAVAKESSLPAALKKANAEVDKIQCDNLFHRTDIARKAFAASIIDGKQLSADSKAKVRAEVELAAEKYGRVPCLTVILVGENPASQSYVKGKIKACEVCGIESRLITRPADISEEELLALIDQLNADESVDGILVQLPLPAHINEDKVIDAIRIEKDVDGFHPLNVANLNLSRPCILPCTPKGIIRMLESTGVNLSGCKAVVVGRSNIVGKPVAKLLLDKNATVTIAHSRTKDLAAVCREADVLVAAVGRIGTITADMVKPGAVVIDVGVNRNPETGKLCGDVDFEAIQSVASAITPVPGGVGPMTIAMLMENTLECFIQKMNKA